MPSEKNRRRTPANNNSTSKEEVSQSPFAGCSIIIAAAVMMLFLVGFTIWSLFRVEREIGKFTESTAKPTPVLDPDLFESQFNDLSQRLDRFQAEIMAENPAEITLSTQDINLSIATHPQFDELRKTFHILSISPEGMEVQISYRINRKPLGDSSYRYLNGTFIGQPRLESGQVLIDIDTMTSARGIVPDEFAAHLSDHQITAPYLEDKVLGPVMKKLTTLELSNDKLIIRADPAKEPPGKQELTRADIDKTKRIALTSFGIVIVIFALFLSIFLSLRNKK